jgi:ABC-type iron transport system FetAB ATPase subunit
MLRLSGCVLQTVGLTKLLLYQPSIALLELICSQKDSKRWQKLLLC